MSKSQPPESKPPQKNRKKIFIISGSLILIAVSLTAFFYFYSPKTTPQVTTTNIIPDAEEQTEDARLADPRIAKLVNEHTKNTPWKLSEKPKPSFKENHVVQINHELTMTSPAQSEDETQQSAKIAQAKYAAQYMSPELIDVLYQEYHQNGKAVLASFGINQVCQMNGCKYQVSPESSLLQAYQGQVEKGDTIDSINGQSLTNVTDYQSAKNLIFQNNPTMIQLTSAQGNQRIIYINHSKSSLSSNL